MFSAFHVHLCIMWNLGKLPHSFYSIQVSVHLRKHSFMYILILIVILWDGFWKTCVVLWAVACFFWTQFFHTKTSGSSRIHACMQRVTAMKCSEPARWIKSQLEGAPQETQYLYLVFEIRNWSWYGGKSVTEIAKAEGEKQTYF